MRTQRYFLLALFAFQMLVASAAIKEVEQNTWRTHEISKHEVLDIVLEAKGDIAQPFEQEVNAIFTSPSGNKQVVPAFFDGDGEWVVRFSASEVGKWSYEVESELKSLNQKRGKVEVLESIYNQRKGEVVIPQDNPRKFAWESGENYFLMAFECDFLFALDYNDEEAPRRNHFLDKVAENGFNHIVMNVYANDVVWKKDKKLEQDKQYEFGGLHEIYPFFGNNDFPDFSSLNVEFFQNLDRTIEALNDRNIVSHLMIYVWNKNVNWPEMNTLEDNRYFDYVVKRYQAFTNVVWDISKEALYYGRADDAYILERIERLRKLDSYERLMTVHDAGFCYRHLDAVDFVSNQNWKLGIYDLMNDSYQKHKNHPTFNIEHGGYEMSDYEVFCGNYINAEICLRRNYECAFAGAYSTYYWQGCSWNVLVYDWDTQSGNHYRPKFEYFKYMTEFFNRYPYQEFSPKPAYNNSGYCMGNEAEDTYLFYFPKESYKCAAHNLMSRAKRISYRWFNTVTGEYTETQEVPEMNMFAMPSSPWHMQADAILIFKVEEFKK